MSFLIKSPILRHLSLHRRPFTTTPKQTHWNKDFKPGPYPRTMEERNLAAEKYNLHSSDYHPFPDDGLGLGDYPRLPDQGYESRDPYYPWDNPEHMRNFGEPLHAEFGLVRQDRYNLGVKLRYPLWVQVLQFVGVMFVNFGLMCFFEVFKAFHPVTPRQYPHHGKKHYTFEPEN